MKKKWIALKRRWKKLSPFDRRFYKGQVILVVFNLLMSILTLFNLLNIMWIILLTLTFSFSLSMRRRTAYLWYYKGRFHQNGVDHVKAHDLVEWAKEVANENKQLNSDYKKLEYDYNQLKKNINPKKNKK
jgi:hypothetical protein